ncbi:unnamed protein product [Dibothriocephalus latus]|uniref:SH3 domain-containing protein n=1 Tax=Dibothriocephalus latus TaxID=60516 RepID=A0A3P7LEW2_DIBLA|nr:unnamed protein product [Dibothriocephalus latus]
MDPPELAIVESAFTADGVGQISLVAKQYVKVQRKSASGWCEGEIQDIGLLFIIPGGEAFGNHVTGCPL